MRWRLAVSGLVIDGRPEGAARLAHLHPLPSVLELGRLEGPRALEAVRRAAAIPRWGIHDPLWQDEPPLALEHLAAPGEAEAGRLWRLRLEEARRRGADYLLVHAPDRQPSARSAPELNALLVRARRLADRVGIRLVVEPKAAPQEAGGMGLAVTGGLPSLGREGPELCADLSDLRTAAEVLGLSVGRAARPLAGRAAHLHLHARHRAPTGGWQHAPFAGRAAPRGPGWQLTELPWAAVRRLARRTGPVQLTVEVVAYGLPHLPACIATLVRRFGPPLGG